MKYVMVCKVTTHPWLSMYVHENNMPYYLSERPVNPKIFGDPTEVYHTIREYGYDRRCWDAMTEDDFMIRTVLFT